MSSSRQVYIFNAGNQLQAGEFNANNKNTFSLGLFNYLSGLAGANAQGTQNDINTTTSLNQQNAAQNAASQAQGQAQNANTIGSRKFRNYRASNGRSSVFKSAGNTDDNRW